VPRQRITSQKIAEHVQRLGETYPPIRLGSVDRTINRPDLVARKFGHVIDYLARVELEVDRNVLELLCLLPDVDETNKKFYSDAWQPQEIQHGLVLDRLQQDLGRQAAKPHVEVSFKIKILGALANLKPVQDIAKLLYYLTGASTERQAVLAYSQLNDGLRDLGETAISETIVTPIKQQEPGHFAFYQMSATAMIQDKVLKPWQLFLARVLRESSYHLVGTNAMKRYKADMGGVMVDLGFDADLEGYSREVGRVEARLLWAHKQGMEFPPYILKALRSRIRHSPSLSTISPGRAFHGRLSCSTSPVITIPVSSRALTTSPRPWLHSCETVWVNCTSVVT
jgi:hypothetical protein